MWINLTVQGGPCRCSGSPRNSRRLRRRSRSPARPGSALPSCGPTPTPCSATPRSPGSPGPTCSPTPSTFPTGWKEAVAFVETLNARTLEKHLKVKYVLPSEAQWEYSCRGGHLSKQFKEMARLPFFFKSPSPSLGLGEANLQRGDGSRWRCEEGQLSCSHQHGQQARRRERAGPLRHARQRVGVVFRLVRPDRLLRDTRGAERPDRPKDAIKLWHVPRISRGELE